MSEGPIRRSGDGVRIAVWLVPGASSAGVSGLHGDHLKVRVTAPPEAGRANAEAAKLLGGLLGCEVTLERGMKARSKMFKAPGIEIGEAARRLGI